MSFWVFLVYVGSESRSRPAVFVLELNLRRNRTKGCLHSDHTNHRRLKQRSLCCPPWSYFETLCRRPPNFSHCGTANPLLPTSELRPCGPFIPLSTLHFPLLRLLALLPRCSAVFKLQPSVLAVSYFRGRCCTSPFAGLRVPDSIQALRRRRCMPSALS